MDNPSATKKNIRNYNIRFICLGILTCLAFAKPCNAQNASFEFWPETDIWYKLSPSWRLSSFIPITKYNESKSRDLNIYLQADYSWGRTKRTLIRRLVDENSAQQLKTWVARGGVMKGWGIGDNEGDYLESMLFAEIHKRVPIKGGILFSQRLRADFRWLGQEPNYSYRLRYRAMIEKEFNSGKCSIVPYINGEPYWDSRYNTISRMRVVGGTTVAWGPILALEGNLTYQHDEHYNTSNLYALNIILHIFLESRNAKRSH
jgi:hypothetical protein